jgi:hypothetical protein
MAAGGQGQGLQEGMPPLLEESEEEEEEDEVEEDVPELIADNSEDEDAFLPPQQARAAPSACSAAPACWGVAGVSTLGHYCLCPCCRGPG